MTTTYTFEQLKQDVRKEAEALKVHATKEERERLNIDTFDSSSATRCIYGLMCKVCDSDRAIDLIELCAPIIYSIDHNGLTPERVDRLKISRRWSPIEAYVGEPEANNANLIAFLRGETETLEL